MNNFLRSVLFISVGLALGVTICYFEPESFKGSWLNMIVRQYDYYRNLKEPGKILVIGGSSVACGIDLDVMENQTGRSCAEFGVHLGMGESFLMEASKCNLRPDDVVVIEFYNMPIEKNYKTELILDALGKRKDMYRYFLPRYWSEVVREYPKYVMKSYFYSVIPFPDNGYVGSSFDARGCAIKLREKKSDSELDALVSGEKSRFSLDELSQDYLNDMNNFVDYCKSRDVSVFFTLSPLFDETITINEEDSERLDQFFSSNMHAPLITSLKDSMYSREYIWDTVRHLTSEGAKIRSERLAKELLPYLQSAESSSAD